MLQTIHEIAAKNSCLAIGLMSGTCTDGIDAALVEISGQNTGTKVNLIDFITIPYPSELREKLLTIAGGSMGGSYELSKLNVLLGTLFADACLALCRQSGTDPYSIDFVGSHGHTVYHQPVTELYFGREIRSTLQIGEASLISERLGCPVVSDFRVRDMAAGGLGAPLVPYTEFLLYRDPDASIALQNIGGIGNITFLPAGCDLENVLAFDTGPGNMIIDSLVSVYTKGSKTYDEGGKIAAGASLNDKLLTFMMEDDYLLLPPPKTTGREYYGAEYMERLLSFITKESIPLPDAIKTATMFTAKTIVHSMTTFLPHMPKRLIIGGGGSLNNTLLSMIRSLLPHYEAAHAVASQTEVTHAVASQTEVTHAVASQTEAAYAAADYCEVLTNEDLSLDSNAKEAVAFAVLANETLHYRCNNAPSATGASHPVVMGKISI